MLSPAKNRELGKILRRYRRKRGFTLDELSVVLGVSKVYLSQVENGRRPCSAKILRRYIKTLEIPRIGGILFEHLIDQIEDLWMLP